MLIKIACDLSSSSVFAVRIDVLCEYGKYGITWEKNMGEIWDFSLFF